MGPLINDPPWLAIAWEGLGEKEIPGPQSNDWIENLWLRQPGGRWFWEHFGRDDSKLPWCGAFTADCMRRADLDFPKHYARAKAWANWGVRLDRPVHGCVVVFGRSGGGHVGFVVGEDRNGNLLVLGGNQNDAVKVSAFKRASAVAFRWPGDYPTPSYFQLAQGSADASTSQA